MTPQQQMQATLAKTGIPYREIKCYGSQIMITTKGRGSAEKWAAVLQNFAKVRMGQGVDYAKQNKNTVLRPSTVKVWRVWGTIQ